MALKQIERQIDAILLEIDCNVLPEVCKLQGGTGRIREAKALRIGVSAETQHQSPHWIRGVPAVCEKLVPAGVPAHPLILLECPNQVVERLDGDSVASHCAG